MVNSDMKDTNIAEKFQTTLEEKGISIMKKAWAGFQKLGFWFTLATLIGVWAGIQGCKIYYKEKMNEVIQTGSFLYDKKVYSVNPR